MTLGLAWTISRPLERLVLAARRIAKGDMAVEVPSGGGGELSELSTAFSEMTRKLEARQRYISEFAADVAHAFKSPLTSIRGAADLLADGAAEEPEARRRFLSNISLDAERLDRLVSRLLELSRIDASDAVLSAIVLEDLVRRAVERAQDPSGSVVLDYRSSVPLIRGRAGDLEIAILNLLDNAIRFSPTGERVHVTVDGRAGDSLVVISVSDSGPGIPPEHQPRLFERFFTTEAEGEGTGLGLAIVKSVVDAHSGRIQVESTPGSTTFRISLPLGFEPKRRGAKRAKC
jgi:two-component system sensor histidine kinase ChvG